MKFGTPEEDAYRRDLTINSLFYNINTSSVEDFTGKAATHTPAQPPQMVIGMGVTAGPIPEDFFQNTTSAIGALATFESCMTNPAAEAPGWPQAGAMPHLMDGPAGTTGVPPNFGLPPGSAVPSSFGLPGSGVPAQSAPMAGRISPSTDPFSGGIPPSADQFSRGVPPTAGPFAGGVPQPSVPASTVQSAGYARSDVSSDLGSLIAPGTTVAVPRPNSPPVVMRPGQVPRGAPASKCFKAGVSHLEQNQLVDAMSCFDEGFLAMAKDQSLGQDIRTQATICAQYKLAVLLLQEITRLQKVQGANAISAKDEIARLSRHLSTLPLSAKHRTMCVRTAIKRNMDVQNFAFAKSLLDMLLSKAPTNKQDELRSLINLCNQRGLNDRSIDPSEDPAQFCAATLQRLSTIGYDACDICGSKFSTVPSPICIICGMGTITRSDAVPKGAVASPFS